MQTLTQIEKPAKASFEVLSAVHHQSFDFSAHVFGVIGKITLLADI